MIDLMQRRREMMGSSGNPLPYDAEIEYIEATGTQYINTGIAPLLFGDEIEGEFMKRAGNNSGTILGADKENTVAIVPIASSGKIWCRVFAANSASCDYFGGEKFSIKIKDGVCTYTQRRTWVLTMPSGQSETSISIPLYIFARNGVANSNSPGLCYSFSIKRNGEKILDLIPVRVGQVGYMYDKVSGQLFGNDGTGDFTLGPDVTQ